MVVVAARVCFFNDTATTEIYTLSLHDALPISLWRQEPDRPAGPEESLRGDRTRLGGSLFEQARDLAWIRGDLDIALSDRVEHLDERFGEVSLQRAVTVVGSGDVLDRAPGRGREELYEIGQPGLVLN